jgi:exosortase
LSSIEQTRTSDPAEEIRPPLASRRPLRAKDVVLAVGAGLVVAISPLTSRELLPSAAAGILVSAGVLSYLRRRALAHAPTDTRLGLSPRDGLAFGGLLLAFGVALWPTFVQLGEHWTGSLWTNGHGLFMPPAIAYLGWQALRKLPDERATGTVWGFAVVVPALVVAILGQSIGSLAISTVGLVGALPGFSLLLFGTRGTRALAVPLSLGLLMVPIPNAVASHMHLRQMTASVVAPLFSLLGFLNFRDGTVIQTPDQVFVVADACSGFSTLYASVSVAIILGAMGGSLRLAALLLAASVPLAMAANILRVLGLVVATQLMGVWVLDSPLHVASGMATFFISLGGLFWLYGRWKEQPSS